MRSSHIGFLLAAITLLCGCVSTGQEKPDIFLIIIDTLRADHLSCYGYERTTSPVLDSLAASGTLFANCQAQAPWTLPAHASIWTGLSVESHSAGIREQVTYGLDSALDNIATMLHEEGYVTLGFVNVILLNNDFGFANGFDHYSWYAHGHGRAAATVDEVLEWFSLNRSNSNPKFTVIHLFDVHSPYDPPSPFDELFAPLGTEGITTWEVDSLGYLMNPDDNDHLIDLYDGEIAWVDSQLGRLFDELRKSGIADNALIIVTSDHGEEFLDHGQWAHGHTMYQELLHVPLIVSGPGIPEGIVDPAVCGQFDILPVIAGYTDIPVPVHVEGIDLFNRPDSAVRYIPSSGAIPGHHHLSDYRDYECLCSVLDESIKGIKNFNSMEDMLFDLENDPAENDPLPLDSIRMYELDRYWSTPPIADPPAVIEECVDNNLRDMGYL